MSNHSQLIVVVGETASGKSALAMELARRFNGEIIAADSWTVRREVSIGTAKPTKAERAEIPHHLLDVVGPCDDFTAAVFKKLANEAIKDIIGRGKLPIMVGGTGLYIDSVLYDFTFLPEGDRKARAELNNLTNQELIARIEALGHSLDGIDTRNKRRLIRVLEAGGQRPEKGTIRPYTLILGVKIPHGELKKRITNRVDAMIKRGLEMEVRQLTERYGWDCEALKGIGYKEWQGYFDGDQTLDETRYKIIKNTLALAKRQRTWFRRNKSIQWVNDPRQIVDIATTFLNTSSIAN